MSVVRNEEIPEMGAFAKAVAWAVKEMTASAGISGSALARRLGRAQSYASIRLNGRKAWTLDELDRIADMIGTTVDVLMLRAASMREVSPPRPVGLWRRVAWKCPAECELAKVVEAPEKSTPLA